METLVMKWVINRFGLWVHTTFRKPSLYKREKGKFPIICSKSTLETLEKGVNYVPK